MSLKLMVAAALFAVGTGAVGDAFAPAVVVLPVGIVTDDDRGVEVVKELDAVSRLDVTDRDAAVEVLDTAEDKLDSIEEAAEEKLDATLEICDDAALAADGAADTVLEAIDAALLVIGTTRVVELPETTVTDVVAEPAATADDSEAWD
jgi:hypothetical protein